MLLQPDGKIVIASNALESVNGVTTNRIARLTSAGALDAALGVTGDVQMSVFAVALQTDGKIVLGGGDGSGTAITRLNSDGTVDGAFAPPALGLVSIDSLAIQADGRILVGARGRHTVNGNLTDGLIRLNSNGSHDVSFDPPDVRTAFSLLVQTDGKIAVGGSFTVNFGLFLASFGRLNPDGSLDFMTNGGGPDNDVFDIAQQPDGKFIAVGAFENFYQKNDTFIRTGVARILESAAAPLPGKIAFTSDRDGNADIYLMNPDGTGQTRLTTNAAEDHSPSITIDGSKIAFFSDRNDRVAIYTMNADGSDQTALTDENSVNIDPAFSPDKSKIAFISNRDGNNAVFIMNADGTNQTRVTNVPTARDREPAFSPDGSKIVFTSLRFNEPAEEIFTINIDGTNELRLTNNSVSDVSASWAPDGTKIAFASTRDGHTQIYVMNVDGTDQTRVSNNAHLDLDPSFSPDSMSIAFTSFRDGNAEIYHMTADGSAQIRITSLAASDSLPSWGGAFITPPPPSPLVKAKIEGGNILVGSPGEGLILRSAGGVCVKIAIDNSGALTTAVIQCP